MEHQITIVGIGPGHPDFILPAAASAIRQAKTLAGSRRALDTFSTERQITRVVDGNIPGLIEWLKQQLIVTDVVVMVSGDPGYHSLLDAIRREMHSAKVFVIPGLSSFQLAFARLALPWHDARLLSFHGREPEPDQLCFEPGLTLSFLTDPRHNPLQIGKRLIQVGWSSASTVWLCKNLSYDSETILQTDLNGLASTEGFESCVMVVKG